MGCMARDIHTPHRVACGRLPSVKRALLLLPFLVLDASAAVSPHAIAAHIRFLASDALEGRETGTRGYDTAAAYVAAQFEAVGLETVGGSWMQPLKLRGAAIEEASSSIAIDGAMLVSRKDYILRPDFARTTTDVAGPVVLAGFGVTAPELGWDDYRTVDVRGKIVLLLSGAPASFAVDQRAYYSAGDVKRKNATLHGAVAVLTLSSIGDEKRYPFAKRAAQSSATSMVYLAPDGTPSGVTPSLRAQATLSRQAADRLFAGAPTTLETVLADAEQGVAHSMPLKTSVAIHTASNFSEVSSANVVGLLRGRGAALRNEYVVVTAHLDHLGNHPPAGGGDGLYNGAMDNGVGIAVLIEMARAMSQRPRGERSVLFVALTAEEKGEQGSEFFVHFPPVNADAIVADVNMDMFSILYPVADVAPLGGEHSDLGALAARAARETGFEVSPDPLPEEVRFIRSDQYSFVKAGIPAIHIKAGNRSTNPAVDGAKVTRDWLRTIYHSPKDDLSQHFDFASGARYAELNQRLVEAIASGPRPRWKSGDFFGGLFAHPTGRKATITLRH